MKDKEHIPALKDCPHVIADMKKIIGELLVEIALLQHRVMMLEVKNGKM